MSIIGTNLLCNFCKKNIIGSSLLEHIFLKHKKKHLKIMGNINYLKLFQSKNINESKYIINTNMNDDLINLCSTEYNISIEEFIINIFLNNLYEHNNIKYIENNLFLIYYNNKWIIDKNNINIKYIINNFIIELKHNFENNIKNNKYILSLFENAFNSNQIHNILLDCIKNVNNIHKIISFYSKINNI
jgi:hypothetical protein